MPEARILIYDIETSYLSAETWGPKWNANLLRVTDASHLLSVGYKWLGEEETTVLSLPDYKRSYRRNRKDDRMLVQDLHKLFDQSDIRIAHNGDNFDEKVAKARMAYHNLGIPSQSFTIDTKKAVKRHFRLPSNSLNDVAAYFDLGAKLQHTGLHLWQAVAEGDPEAWALMVEYNRQDVELLERLYLKLRDGGWIDNHPNLATISGNLHNCPKCGGDNNQMQKRGTVHTRTMSYQQWFCHNCKSYSRQRKVGTGPRFN